MFVRQGSLEIYNRWQEVVRDYSNLEMTKESDKLAALSGLAHKVASITGDLYLAGIWKNDLARGLLWEARRRMRSPLYQAPTWSWCSMAGSIRLNSYPGLRPVMKFVRADLLGDDPYHHLQTGSSLTLLGMIVQGRERLISDMRESSDIAEPQGGNRMFIEIHDFDHDSPDRALSIKGLDMWYFPVGIGSDLRSGFKQVYYGLCLAPIGKKKDEYKRIGWFIARDYSIDAFHMGFLPDPTLVRQEVVFGRHRIKEIIV